MRFPVSQDETFSISGNSPKRGSFAVPIRLLKEAVLGQSYRLSIAFVTEKIIAELNGRFRGKKEPSDILSFSLSKQSGEIFICFPVLIKKACLRGETVPKYASFLVIHGLLHLKGYTHGDRMEAQETKFRKQFEI